MKAELVSIDKIRLEAEGDKDFMALYHLLQDGVKVIGGPYDLQQQKREIYLIRNDKQIRREGDKKMLEKIKQTIVDGLKIAGCQVIGDEDLVLAFGPAHFSRDNIREFADENKWDVEFLIDKAQTIFIKRLGG